jgi:hypothetical protein
MSATIHRNAEQIVIRTTGTISQIEAQEVRASVESMLRKSGRTQLVFMHTGKLPLQVLSYQIWEILLACLKSEHVHSVCFSFEKENTPFRFLAQEYARRADVPCVQHDSIEQVRDCTPNQTNNPYSPIPEKSGYIGCLTEVSPAF